LTIRPLAAGRAGATQTKIDGPNAGTSPRCTLKALDRVVLSPS
jgi:hypothetical protein